MSYSRWGPSNWYAFHSSSSGDDLDSQVLALWHCGDESLPDFSYADLEAVDAEWLHGHYPTASVDDIREALDIIAIFKRDVRGSLAPEEEQADA